MVDSFTMGTPAMIAAMFRRLPEHYSMSLNRTDMQAVIVALGAAAGFYDHTEEDQDMILSLFSSIAETLGVEGI